MKKNNELYKDIVKTFLLQYEKILTLLETDINNIGLEVVEINIRLSIFYIDIDIYNSLPDTKLSNSTKISMLRCLMFEKFGIR